eukprot:755559-Hanusia_phi.AAC.2
MVASKANHSPDRHVISNSERKDRSIRLWGGCARVRMVPLLTVVSSRTRAARAGEGTRLRSQRHSCSN